MKGKTLFQFPYSLNRQHGPLKLWVCWISNYFLSWALTRPAPRNHCFVGRRTSWRCLKCCTGQPGVNKLVLGFSLLFLICCVFFFFLWKDAFFSISLQWNSLKWQFYLGWSWGREINSVSEPVAEMTLIFIVLSVVSYSLWRYGL